MGTACYGRPNPAFEWQVEDEDKVTLSEIAPRVGAQFAYEYDMGDEWVHAIKVEAITRPDKPSRYATCVEGARACPPEDSGGMDRYEEILRILRDPLDKEYKDTRSWAGRGFNPESFDSKLVNAKLKRRPRLVR